MRRTGHILLLHHSEGERLRWLADWCEVGLRREEKVVYVDVAGWGAESLTEAIERRGLDVTSAVKSGQFEFVGIEEMLALGNEGEDVLTAALDAGYAGARLTVRQDALIERVGRGTADLVEQRVATLCHESPVSVLCQYDGRTTVGDALARTLDDHPDWVFESELSLHRSGHVIAVEGQLDALDEGVLLRSLTRMTRRLNPSEPLALDMRGVTAMSLGVTRALVDGTEAFRRRGGVVRVGSRLGSGDPLLRMLRDLDEAGLEVQ